MKILKEIWFWTTLIIMIPIIEIILRLDGYYKEEFENWDSI